MRDRSNRTGNSPPSPLGATSRFALEGSIYFFFFTRIKTLLCISLNAGPDAIYLLRVVKMTKKNNSVLRLEYKTTTKYLLER